MSASEQAIETRIVKAFSHPLRFRILQLLNEREASPSALAQQLDGPLGNVSYHVKILREAEAIELVGRPVRGAIEHVYRATARPTSTTRLRALPARSARDDRLDIAGAGDTCCRRPAPGRWTSPRPISRGPRSTSTRGAQRGRRAPRLDPGRAMEIQAESAGSLGSSRRPPVRPSGPSSRSCTTTARATSPP